jgi:hypothetical protein
VAMARFLYHSHRNSMRKLSSYQVSCVSAWP